MASSYRIYPHAGVVIFTLGTHVTVAEERAKLDRYFADPEARPGQKHCIDCSAVVSYEHDFSGIMAIQARVADDIVPAPDPTLLVIYAPPGPPREVANLIANAWRDSGAVVVRLAETTADALSLLGLTDANLLQPSDTP